MVTAGTYRSSCSLPFRFAFSVFVLFLVLIAVSALSATLQHSSADGLRLATGLLGTLAGVGLVSVVVFEGLVRRVRPGLPRIVPDVLTTIAGLVALIRASSNMGFDLGGVIATSAVLTAVIGLTGWATYNEIALPWPASWSEELHESAATLMLAVVGRWDFQRFG